MRECRVTRRWHPQIDRKFSKEEVDSEFDEDEAAILALSKICLNNWHYIDQKVLSFNDGINFFTGHSGSGKSTVIDAMQIVFICEYRMVVDSLIRRQQTIPIEIWSNTCEEWLRSERKMKLLIWEIKTSPQRSFLEFTQTESDEKECLGVVFWCRYSKKWYIQIIFLAQRRHFRECLPYGRACDDNFGTPQIYAEKLQKEDFYFGTSNERFRKQMYDIYLGGLDMEKFPRLFKRAIPLKWISSSKICERIQSVWSRTFILKICRKAWCSMEECVRESKIH